MQTHSFFPLRRAVTVALSFLAALPGCDEKTPTDAAEPVTPSLDETPLASADAVSALAIQLPVNQNVATAAPNPAFRINQTGTGPNGIFQITRSASTQAALQGLTNGRGRAGFFRVQNSASLVSALESQTNGPGLAIQGLATGTGGAGLFEIRNADSRNDALTAVNNGIGRAGVFRNSNTDADSPVLQVNSAGGNNVAIFTLVTGTGGGGWFQVSNTASSFPAVDGRTTGTGPGVQGISDRGLGGFFESHQGGGLRSVTHGNGPAGVFQITNAGTNNQNALEVYGNPLVANRRAAHFVGNVNVVGTLTKSGGSFRIDHPLDPEHKYLSHSFVESPDMMNVYNGNVTLDANGRATVELPDYFEALNRDFRYQLTAVGSPGPNLYIAEGVKQNRFRIAGGRAYAHVSWQVTGVRQDPYAEAHRIQVEEEKPQAERSLVVRR